MALLYFKTNKIIMGKPKTNLTFINGSAVNCNPTEYFFMTTYFTNCELANSFHMNHLTKNNRK